MIPQQKQMQTHDWQVPQRQSIAAIFIIFIKTIWELIKQTWILLLLLIFQKPKHEDGEFYRWLSLGVFVTLSILVTLLRYWFYKFSIQDNNLLIKSGWWQKKRLSIPLKSIQAVHIEQNIWQQLFGVARVSFDSAGSERMEARIEALPLQKAETLKKIILQEIEAIPSEIDAPLAPKKVYALTENDIWRLSLSANHFKAFLLILFFSFQILDDIINILDADQKDAIEEYADSAWGDGLNLIFLFSVLGMVAFVSIAVSALRVMLEFYNFKMEETAQGWKVSHGLLTQKQKVIPRTKIQMIEYGANWLRSVLNIWTLELHITGQDKIKQQSRLIVPLTSLAQTHEFTESYLAYASVRKGGKKIHVSYWGRTVFFFALPISCLVGLISYLFLQSIWWAGYTTLFLWIYGIIHLYIWRKNYRWLAQEDGLHIYKGVWGQTYQLLSWQKIQQVRMRQSLYQYKRNLADLRFITASGEITIPYIPLSVAHALMNQTIYRIETIHQSWS